MKVSLKLAYMWTSPNTIQSSRICGLSETWTSFLPIFFLAEAMYVFIGLARPPGWSSEASTWPGITRITPSRGRSRGANSISSRTFSMCTVILSRTLKKKRILKAMIQAPHYSKLLWIFYTNTSRFKIKIKCIWLEFKYCENEGLFSVHVEPEI